jgi:hypothetical protein
MKWKAKKPIEVGAIRIVKRFAWLPITISTVTVWLETVYIKQERMPDFGDGWSGTGEYWKNCEFVDQQH